MEHNMLAFIGLLTLICGASYLIVKSMVWLAMTGDKKRERNNQINYIIDNFFGLERRITWLENKISKDNTDEC